MLVLSPLSSLLSSFFVVKRAALRQPERMSIVGSVGDSDTDAVLMAVDAAPVVPFSSAETQAFAEGLADIRAGRTVASEQVHKAVIGAGQVAGAGQAAE